MNDKKEDNGYWWTVEKELKFRQEWDFWRGYILGKYPKNQLKNIKLKGVSNNGSENT